MSTLARVLIQSTIFFFRQNYSACKNELQDSDKEDSDKGASVG